MARPRRSSAPAPVPGGPIPPELADPAHEDLLTAADVREARQAAAGDRWMVLDMAARAHQTAALMEATGLTRTEVRAMYRTGQARRPRWRDGFQFAAEHLLEP